MKFSLVKVLPYGILAILIFLQLVLIYKTLSFDQAGNLRTIDIGFGDTPFHLTEVTYFGDNSLFKLQETIFSGAPLKYSFFINWISGLLLKITGNLLFSFHLPSMLLMAGGTILTFILYRKFLKNEWLALLGVFVFWLGGGLGGHAGEQNISLANPLTSFFMHQRAFFLGYFLFLLFAYCLWRLWETNRHRFLIASGIILGISPMAHYQTFVVMGIATVILGILALLKKDSPIFKKILLVLLIGFLVSLPQVIYLLSGGNALHSFIHFRLGWMSPVSIGQYLSFLWINFGVILPVALIALILAIKTQQKSSILWLMLGFAIFAAVQLIQFQPWDFDDNKMLVYFQFFVIPPILFMFSNWRKSIGISLLMAFSAAAIFAAIPDLASRVTASVSQRPIIFTKNDLSFAQFVRTNIPPTDIIMTSDNFLNPVASLAGHPAIMGYTGWLWSHGINYQQRQQDLSDFYRDPSRTGILKKYNAKYVLLDQTAMSEWGANKTEFDKEFKKVYQNESITLYKTGL